MTRIGPYEIVAGPFVGGFGEVYRVFDRDSGDEFALKTLREAFLSTSQRVERFRREINLWIRIPVHPNVVRAIRAFNHGDRSFVKWPERRRDSKSFARSATAWRTSTPKVSSMAT
jgi:serine/threonine protein kinase